MVGVCPYGASRRAAGTRDDPSYHTALLSPLDASPSPSHIVSQLEEAARFEAERAEELRKLQRDRRVLEKQSRAILKMPTKQSKEEVAAVEVRWQGGLGMAE